MSRVGTALVAALSLAFGASGTMAEVRIDRSDTGRELVLQVTPTAAGPWTPLENLDDAAVLNPHGDLLGDGAPGWAHLGDAVVVAWARPATSDVAIASSRGHDWSAGEIPAASRVIGVPRVAGTQRDLLVAWNVASGAGMSSAQGAIVARRGAPQPPEALARFEFTLAGHLVGVQAIDQSFHVLTLQDGVLVDTIFFVPHPPIDPIKRFDVDLDLRIPFPPIDPFERGATEFDLLGGTGDEFVDETVVRDDRFLVTAAVIGESFHVILFEPSTGTLVDRVVSTSAIEDPPIDIFDRVEVILGEDLHFEPSAGDVSSSAPSDPADWALVAQPSLRNASGAREGHVFTWWSDSRELSFVELDEDGPVLPVETLTAERGPERPERLVQEAIRIVRDRY